MTSSSISNVEPVAPIGTPISRVLVVDDSRLQRRILTRTLKKRGFDIVEADCAMRALEICRTAPPDLVLSDWMMPGMTGLELCRAFRQLPRDNYGYFILLTSKSEKTEIAQGLDAGADDFLTKPVNPGELRARIAAGERILSMQRELSAKNDVIAKTLSELQGLYNTIDADLKQARKIQDSLIPELSQMVGKSSVSVLLEPCGHIGGDLVGMFSPTPSQLGFYSIDVSGHGITSAMMTARLGGHLSGTYFEQNLGLIRDKDGTFRLRDPVSVAQTLNTRLSADRGIEEYCTMAYAVVDLTTGLVKLVQAGHPHPLLLRADGREEFVGRGGLPIGLLPGAAFEQVEFRMHPGDRLLLYSDGFTESTRPDGSMIDTGGLIQMVRGCTSIQSGRAFLEELFERLIGEISTPNALDDDVSAIAFEYYGL